MEFIHRSFHANTTTSPVEASFTHRSCSEGASLLRVPVVFWGSRAEIR